MAAMDFPRGGLDGHWWVAEEVVRPMHAPFRGRFLVLLNSHESLRGAFKSVEYTRKRYFF
jgi:hypothetical protein